MPTAAKGFRVVCLGGSAGGLEAYTGILRNLPADTGMAFVVAQHQRFEHVHLLSQILASATAMPVVEVEHGMLLEPNRVFVMPPGVRGGARWGHFGGPGGATPPMLSGGEWRLRGGTG